jgi:hypothetical protein
MEGDTMKERIKDLVSTLQTMVDGAKIIEPLPADLASGAVENYMPQVIDPMDDNETWASLLAKFERATLDMLELHWQFGEAPESDLDDLREALMRCVGLVDANKARTQQLFDAWDECERLGLNQGCVQYSPGWCETGRGNPPTLQKPEAA